jgi:integrase
MSWKVIKRGQYAYKRVGKFKTAYLVKYRQDGIYLEEPLRNIIDDKDAINQARKRISEMREKRELELTIQQEIKEKSPMVRFETIMDQVIASKQHIPTRKTVEFYLKRVVLPILDKYCPFIQDFGPTGPEDFITWFQTERPGEKLFNPRKYFLQVLRRAKKLDLLNPKVEIKMDNPDPKRTAGKVYSEDEIARLFKHAHGDLELQLLMAYCMGMRRSEILKLKWDRLNPFRKTIALRVEDTKIRKAREFKVTDAIWALLEARRGESEGLCVFPSPRDPNAPVIDNKSAWQRCKKAANVTGRFHDLRHTFLTNEVARKKHQAIDVCIYAGLSLEELQNTYLHPTYQDTAYIAENQDQKVLSIISAKQNLGQNLGQNFLRRQYV